MRKQKTIAEQADQYYDDWDPGSSGSFGAYVIKAELARVRLVRKCQAQHETTRAIFEHSHDPRDKWLVQRVIGGIQACDDLLTALKGRKR